MVLARHRSTIADRLELVRLRFTEHVSRRTAAVRLGYSRSWVRRWSRRSRRGGEAALTPPAPPAPGPLARFRAPLAAAVLASRREHPRLGARRARLALEMNPVFRGEVLPSPRTIERAWKHAGLLPTRVPRTQAPPLSPGPTAAPHAVWQIDHQDHLTATGITSLLVLQTIRDPHAGLTIGGDIFRGPRGASGVPEDDLFDALRRRMAQWGKPTMLSVDGALRFLGQPQRTFPSRLELLCAGWGIVVHQIRPGRPTDHGSVERTHQILDAVVIGPPYPDPAALQTALDDHLTALNERFPSRAKNCRGQPPLVAFPQGRHSGRPFAPAQEWATFDLLAVDRFLAGWTWYRRAYKANGQISFANRNIGLGQAHAGTVVVLRFDPTTREVIAATLGSAPDQPGVEIKRFLCPTFTKEAILGSSTVASRPLDPGAHSNDAPPLQPGGTTL
jgi:hypothetical protein